MSILCVALGKDLAKWLEDVSRASSLKLVAAGGDGRDGVGTAWIHGRGLQPLHRAPLPGRGLPKAASPVSPSSPLARLSRQPVCAVGAAGCPAASVGAFVWVCSLLWQQMWN